MPIPDLSDEMLDKVIALRTSDLKEATDEKRRRLEGKVILCECKCGCRADCAPFLIPCCSACGIGIHTSIHVVENPDANT